MQGIQPVVFDDIFLVGVGQSVPAGKIDAADVPSQNRNVCVRIAVRFIEIGDCSHIIAEIFRGDIITFEITAVFAVEFHHELMAFLQFIHQLRMASTDIFCSDTAAFFVICNQDTVTQMTQSPDDGTTGSVIGTETISGIADSLVIFRQIWLPGGFLENIRMSYQQDRRLTRGGNVDIVAPAKLLIDIIATLSTWQSGELVTRSL